ncbi:MAG: type II toxin-antitoxin system PemK/MazF family toxin [Proteobacteria bacterium]|nr:type II toxin-antitoxin system PemK/MazF family toxin [Pseudomonadota bacterium]
MALKFHPNPGTILVCKYEPGFVEPEMVKTRPVIVITPRLRNRDGLCTVVPLSLTEPSPVQNYHCLVQLGVTLPHPWNGNEGWAKADMLATVGFHRLDLIRLGKDHEGKRKYLQRTIAADQLRLIQTCVLHALNLGHLTI